MFALKHSARRITQGSAKIAQERLFNTDSAIVNQLDRFGELMEKLGVPKEQYSAKDGVQTKSPLTGEVLATMKEDNSEHVAKKAKQASQAAKEWAKFSPKERMQYNDIVGQVLKEREGDHKELLSIVTAKPKDHAYGEIEEASVIAQGASKSYQAYLKHQEDSKVKTQDGKQEIAQDRDATGVFAMPGAYNFPFLISGGLLHSLPIMVSGGAAVGAPNPVNSAMSLAVEQTFEEANKRFKEQTGKKVPEGLMSFVQGREAAQKLVKDENINGGIVFTGSSGVDDKISELAHNRKLKYIGEGGGNNPILLTS